jgi:hypothetical protein
MSAGTWQREPNGPVDGAFDAVARLADAELALGPLDGDLDRPPDTN